MVVRTQMSILTGALVWGFAMLSGLPLAQEWGVIAFTLNYIPFIGPFIATLFPTLLSMVQFETWQAVIVVFACLNVIQFVVGSYIEPRLSGSALAMSPFVVLFSIFLWTFLWGLPGNLHRPADHDCDPHVLCSGSSDPLAGGSVRSAG